MSAALGNAITRVDIFGSARCVFAFAALLLTPGYCVAHLLNFLELPKQSPGARLAWGTAASFAAVPILAVEIAKYTSLSLVCWLAGCFSLLFLGIADARGV